MKYGRYGWSHRFLRWGIGATFLWIGIDILKHPQAWIGYVPPDLPITLAREDALRINGIADAALGIVILMGWLPKTSALLAALHLAGIIIMNGLDAVLIRDVGLLGAALALFVWPSHYRKHRFTKIFKRFKRQPPPEVFEEEL